MIARIAVRHLTPAALARVAEILDVDNTPESLANAMAAASTWADEVKTDTGTGDWHFINLTLKTTARTWLSVAPTTTALPPTFASSPPNSRPPTPMPIRAWSDQDALRFLIHLVGDVHQPLHAISNADQGGNCELLG